jgi:peptidoglycan/LPS O-acetylase OafA/YrhL
MVSMLVIALQRKIFQKLSFSKFKTFLLPFLMAFPLIMTPILDFGGKSIGKDLALFLLGYYILSEESILEKLTKYRYAYLIIMLICDIAMVYLFVWKEKQTGILLSAYNIYVLWFGILGLLGLARCKFDQNNSFTRYMSSRSFMIYIFHFGWLVAIQYCLSKTTLAITFSFIISITATLVLTLLTCEFVKRVPALRCLFGEKRRGTGFPKQQ